MSQRDGGGGNGGGGGGGGGDVEEGMGKDRMGKREWHSETCKGGKHS